MTLTERISAPGPKKILTLDGGGIRGMMTVEVSASCSGWAKPWWRKKCSRSISPGLSNEQPI